MGWWGAKRVDETQETRLTISALSLPQFTQIHSKIFFTLTMNPNKRKVLSMGECRENRSQRTRVEHRPCQLNMSKMPRALSHPLATRLTFEVPVDCPHLGVHEATDFGLVGGFVHDFRMFNLGDGNCFLKDDVGNDAGRWGPEKQQLTISSGDKIPN